MRKSAARHLRLAPDLKRILPLHNRRLRRFCFSQAWTATISAFGRCQQWSKAVLSRLSLYGTFCFADAGTWQAIGLLAEAADCQLRPTAAASAWRRMKVAVSQSCEAVSLASAAAAYGSAVLQKDVPALHVWRLSKALDRGH